MDDTDGAEHVEGAAPAPQLADISSGVTADDDPDVIGRLVHRHGKGPGPVVILRQQRVVRRAEEGFTASRGDAPHQHEHQEAVAEAREHRGDAPEEDAARDDPFPAETVAHQTADRHQHGVEQIEDRGDGADSHIAQPQILADKREHHIENLTVRLVEQVGNPQQSQNFPFVIRAFFTPVTRSRHRLSAN